MDAATQLLIDGLLSMESLVRATITWNGGDYLCCGGAELGGKLLGAGGYRTTAAVTIVVRVSLFSGARPGSNETLTYTSAPGASGRALRIKDVTVFREALLVLQCEDPNQST